MKKILLLVLTPMYLLATIGMIIIIIITALVNNPLYKYPYNSFDKVVDTMSLSKNHRNVIYLMVDMTTGFDVTSVLQGNPALADNFTGFTNYENVITTDWGTNASVPNIFGGYDNNAYYKNHGPISNITFREYMKKCINVLVSAFGNAHWDISCIGNQYYDYDDNKSYWDSNWATLESDFQQYNVKAINANDISRWFYYQKPDVYQKLQLPNKIFLDSTNANFIPITTYLQQTKISDTTNSKFMTIMDESLHTPVTTDKFGNYQNQNGSVTITNIYNSVTGFLNKISNFITYLKANNIYDNTMIVINSDHGDVGVGSLPVSDSDYNHTNPRIDYSDIAKINQKYPNFTRAFPTLLVKPFNDQQQITYNNQNLYTNADALTFIKEYNKKDDAGNPIDFSILDATQDKHYLKQLSDINQRQGLWFASYQNDSLWNDSFTHYLKPNTKFSGDSFLVKNSIYDASNYRVNINRDDYYAYDDPSKWVPITF